MNELQIRLTADIAQLQSALTKAKNTIKSFESETAKESEKGNVGFKRKIGLIESLTNKAKALRTALSQATNEQQVERYNQELEQTSKELTRLNALGRSVTANLSGVGGGFSKVTNQGKGAIGVTQEFNRVIQDAPFGLIGVGNNLQQLASNFALLKSQAGSTGKAVGLAVTSIISPINLGLLAVSALTAAFTAYQMGSLDFIFGTEEVEESVESLNDRLKEYIETLGAVETANLNANKAIASERVEVDALVGVIENENLSKEKRLLALNKLRDLYPGYLQGLSDETVLSQGLRDVYLEIADAIAKRATALALEDELVKLAKERLDLNKKNISDVDNLYTIEQELLKAKAQEKRELELIAEGTVKGTKRLKDAKDVVAEYEELLSTAKMVVEETEAGIRRNKDAVVELGLQYQDVYDDLLEVNSLTSDWEDGSDKVLRTYEKISNTLDTVLDRAKNQRRDDFFTPIGSAESTGIGIESGSATTSGIFEENVKSKILAAEELKKALEGTGITIEDFYKSIASGASEGFSNLDEFISRLVLIQTTAEDAFKILEAGIANTIGDMSFAIGDALANGGNVLEAGGAALLGGLAAILNQLGQLAISTGIAILGIQIALKSLNPYAAIAAGVALVALAGFVGAKSRSLGNAASGGGGGGAVASSGAPPQIFTNAQTVAPPSNQSPNYPRGNDIDFDKAQGRLFVDIEFDKLRFGLDMNAESKQSGG